MHRPTLGLAALLFLLVGGGLWLWKDSVSPGLGGMLFRVGVVLGLFWLALPDLSRISGWLLGGAVAGCLVLAAGGWYYILVALAATGLGWFALRRVESAKDAKKA